VVQRLVDEHLLLDGRLVVEQIQADDFDGASLAGAGIQSEFDLAVGALAQSVGEFPVADLRFGAHFHGVHFVGWACV